MSDTTKAIGGIYQQETEYFRNELGRSDFGITERAKPYKQYPPNRFKKKKGA